MAERFDGLLDGGAEVDRHQQERCAARRGWRAGEDGGDKPGGAGEADEAEEVERTFNPHCPAFERGEPGIAVRVEVRRFRGEDVKQRFQPLDKGLFARGLSGGCRRRETGQLMARGEGARPEQQQLAAAQSVELAGERGNELRVDLDRLGAGGFDPGGIWRDSNSASAVMACGRRR
jgi:hypothetical protein